MSSLFLTFIVSKEEVVLLVGIFFSTSSNSKSIKFILTLLLILLNEDISNGDSDILLFFNIASLSFSSLLLIMQYSSRDIFFLFLLSIFLISLKYIKLNSFSKSHLISYMDILSFIQFFFSVSSSISAKSLILLFNLSFKFCCNLL